jgi:hypothetical protein
LKSNLARMAPVGLGLNPLEPVMVQPLANEDREWAGDLIASQWGARVITSKGELYYPHTFPGFVAFQADDKVGLATYRFEHGDCELVTIQSLKGCRCGVRVIGGGSVCCSGCRGSAVVAYHYE